MLLYSERTPGVRFRVCMRVYPFQTFRTDVRIYYKYIQFIADGRMYDHDPNTIWHTLAAEHANVIRIYIYRYVGVCST